MTKSVLTERQKQLLEMIYQYIESTGYPPSFGEMKGSLNVVSNQSIIDLLTKLENQKLIRRSEDQARSIAILPLGYEILGKPPLIPFLGISHAGSPAAVFEIQGDWQQLSPQVAKLQSEVFIIRVSGDSMINAGIDEGDSLLVQNKEEFVSGDIVLADIEGETTIKRFVSDDSPPYVYLKPENPSYPLIPFTDKMRLIGKVMSILKAGNWKAVN